MTTQLRLLCCACAVAVGALVWPRSPLQGQTTLPSAAQIVASAVQAAGGEAAYKAIKSIHKVGRFELPAQGITGSVEVFSARPAKALVRLVLAQDGKVEYGFDGKVGWEIDPMSGPAVITGRRLTEMADDSWFDGPLHAPDFVKEMTTVTRTEFDGHPAYQIRVVFKSGGEQMEYYDADTKLLLGTEATRETPMGVLPTTSIERDYKKFGPLFQSTTTIGRTMGLEQVLRFTIVEFDSVPPNTFDLPPQVKALIR